MNARTNRGDRIERIGGNRPPAKQSGAALVVALVLVLVSTVLGVTAMRSSGVELQLVANDRYRETTFRVAEAAADRLPTIANITSLINGTAGYIESSATVDTAIDVSARLTDSGAANARGFSLGEDRPGFEMMKLTARAEASIEGVAARRAVVLGSERLIPSRQRETTP